MPRLLSLVLILSARLSIALPAAAAAAGGGSGPLPILKIHKAEYRLDLNLLEFAFTVTNPTDQVLYLDVQGQPASARQGKTLVLSFAAADAAAADTVRPQRVGARQGYQGHRRIHGLGPDTTGSGPHPADPAGAASLKVNMAVYPERSEGEGPAWMLEQAFEVSAKPAPLAKRGRRPPPQKPVKVIKPVE